MKTSHKALLAIVVLALLALGLYLAWTVMRDQAEPAAGITSFEECAAAGYPVMESYPEQCRTPDGRTFTRELREDELSPADAAHIESKRGLIIVSEPQPLALIASPLTIRGQARGTWYFEASFPVRIVDAAGNVLGRHFVTAQGEWMTENFVPFEGVLEFAAPQTRTGTLILEKDNPSGLPENADELRIPIRFAPADGTPPPPAPGQERTIQLYYYDPSRDEDANGNVMCSAAGLVAVERTIPLTQTPIQDAIRLLLRGEITAQEETRGITTEYPLDGLQLTGASLNDGVLTLGFADPNNRTSGGSCRAGILWLQIERTARQFAGVNAVRFQPEDLFQP
jgi:hypothetical protein